MRRPRAAFAMMMAFGLLVALAGSANADPWNNWSVVPTGTFPVTVTALQTSTGWDFTVKVDPTNTQPTWSIVAFAVYVGDISGRPYDEGWLGYNGAGSYWTDLGYGWEWDKYPGGAAFGWKSISGPGSIPSGHTEVFQAVKLKAGFTGWSLHGAVQVDKGAGTPPWQKVTGDGTIGKLGGGGAPIPEPGTLALLATGGIGMLPLLRRRRKA